MPTSQNGWPVLADHEVQTWHLGPTLPNLRLVSGAGGFILLHWALWFHETIESLTSGPPDDWGYASRPIRGSSSVWSNHASGTAVDLNAQLHALGGRNTFRASQMRAIRTRLRGKYAGAIRWGGDYVHRADEMHYELAVSRATARVVGDRLLDTPRGRRLQGRNPGASHW